jgi:hypothetical protein
VLGLYQPLTPRPTNSRPIVRHRLQALHPAQCPDPHFSAFTAPSFEAVGLRVANDS